MDAPKFSRREKDVVELLMQGMSNKQLAFRLGISESTVEFHLKNIYAKLGVGSRAEAILKLGKSTGAPPPDEPGESAVADGFEQGDNEGGSTKSQGQKAFRFFNKWLVLSVVGIGVVVGLALILSRPKAWVGYERECEASDEASVGQVIARANASGEKVHGQFGTTGEAPWDGKPGYVLYGDIDISQPVSVFLKLRYSKNSAMSTPILVYLDDEQTPRASIYPEDQQNWDTFVWTETVYLGKVKRGVHRLRFATDGQQYGVADLDRFILTSETP